MRRLFIMRATPTQIVRRIGLVQTRLNSSQIPETGPGAAKPVSPHVGFYKSFGRPIFKVLLMATLTYQMAYWAWVKLEKDEFRLEKTAEIEELEKELDNLTKSRAPNVTP